MSLLGEDVLARIAGRAERHDRENSFPHEDLADLREVGYLTAAVPVEHGGTGLSLRDLTREHARLAGAAPATALAVGMHLVWTAAARMLLDRGDESLTWLLHDAVKGEIFAFGISEPGNDLVLQDSLTRAEPQDDGGYLFTGTKVFTSLAPVWTRLGVSGRDDHSSGDPGIVIGFLGRDAAGVHTDDDWDTLGMRATQSHTTRLDRACVPRERVARRYAPGPTDDGLVFAVFAAFELLVSAAYSGISRRALELAVAAAHGRVSLRNGGAPATEDPDVRRRIGDAALAHDAVPLQIDALAGELDDLVDRGRGWFPALAGLKARAVTTARRVVEESLLVAGGRGYAAGGELARLYRDVLAGAFHPSSQDAAVAALASAWLTPTEGSSPQEK